MLTYKTKYAKYQVKIIPKYYLNGRRALLMVDDPGGEPVASVTINCPLTRLEPGEVVVKNYSENEGMKDFLLKNKLAVDTGRVSSGPYVNAPIMKITDKLDAMLHEAGFSDPWIIPGKVYGKAVTG